MSPTETDEKQPQTDAGKAMLQAWAQRSWSRFALRLAILDIEAEAGRITPSIEGREACQHPEVRCVDCGEVMTAFGPPVPAQAGRA